MKRNLFRDILRDTNSKKYSMTKVAAFTSLILLSVGVVVGLVIMIINKKVDHILMGEIIALLLTLLGFKNFRSSFNGYMKVEESDKGDLDNSVDDLIRDKKDNDELG